MQGTKYTVALGAVQETMLMTLYGRALEARNGSRLLCDPRAVEIVEALDYDFHRVAGKGQMIGSVLRTAILDAMLRHFLLRAPAATVVEIGAGLSTRFDRLDNGCLRWVDVDLPDVIDLRMRFFEQTKRRRMVASSVLEERWLHVAKDTAGPYLLIAEGVFMYLQEYQLRKVLALIAEKLPGALVIFDTVPSTGHDPQREVTIRPGVRARLAWFCDDPLQVEQWGLGYRLLDSRSIAELPPSVDRVLPFSLRYSLAVARVLGWKIDAYRLNVYRAEGLAAAVRRSPQP